MSRGPGRLQRLVLEIVRGAHGPLTVNEVAWRLGELEGAVHKGQRITADIWEGELDRGFYKALMRATDRLVEVEALRPNKRKLRTPEEVVRAFPFKTLRLPVRSLRHHFLPTVTEIASRRGRVRPEAHVEEQLLRERLEDREVVLSCSERWGRVRDVLHETFRGAATHSEQDIVLRLLAKGTRYFEPQSSLWIGRDRDRVELTEATSLNELLCLARSLLTLDLQPLEGLLTYAVPTPVHQQRDLKDILFRVADFYRDRDVGLKQDLMATLAKQAPSLITSLPGHRPAMTRGKGMLLLREPRETKYSPLLRQVIDRHVLGPFSFISVP